MIPDNNSIDNNELKKQELESKESNNTQTSDISQDQEIKDVEKLQQEITKLQQQVKELQEKLLRQAADNENNRRRYEKMLSEAKDYAIIEFARDLLSVMDNLTRALQYKPEDASLEVQNIIAGVDMTRQELENVFSRHKVSSIAPQLGDKFDYNHHSAMSQVDSPEHEPNTIVNVMQIGYKINERLIRPASVVVAKG